MGLRVQGSRFRILGVQCARGLEDPELYGCQDGVTCLSFRALFPVDTRVHRGAGIRQSSSAIITNPKGPCRDIVYT